VRAHPPAILRAGLRAVTALTRSLGPARYPVADVLGAVAWTVQPRRRRNAVASHRRLDPGISDREARRRARDSFRQFARTGIDFLWANGEVGDGVLRVSRVRGQEHTDRATAEGRGGILALTHFGNWDMAANIAFAIGLPLTTVMDTTGPRAITELVIWARQRNQLEVFETSGAARGLLRALRRNRFVALLCDVPGGGPIVDVDYCGGPVRFSSVPAWLALRIGAPLLPTACWREDGVYHLQAFDYLTASPGDDEQILTQRLAQAIETVVRKNPSQWYPFRPVYSDTGAHSG